MSKLLIVEDDETIALGCEFSLKKEGFEVKVAKNCAEAKKALDSFEFDGVVLDLGLPDGNGFEVCDYAQKKGNPAIIFLTARDDENDIVFGLDMGGDDYITKPFGLKEFISRVNAVLRRRKNTPEQEKIIQLGNLKIYSSKGKVYKNNQEVFLSAMEYRLLLVLANRKGEVIKREELLDSIWDIGGEFINDNTLTVYIKRLREKIEDDPQSPKLIETIRGIGYRSTSR